MSSSMETYILGSDTVEAAHRMTWKEAARAYFIEQAYLCRWKTESGWCRPGDCDCSMENCELVRRYGV